MTIKYEPFDIDYEISSSQDEEGRRHYETPDGVFPSVTTVLDTVTDKTFLIRWKERIGEEEAEKIARRMRIFGTRLHDFLEVLIKTGLPPKSVNWDIQHTWMQLSDEFYNNMGTIHGLETPLWSTTIGVAGRADCFGYWNGLPSIIDFKTSLKSKRREWIENYFIQCVLYSVMLKERFDFTVKQIVIPIFSINGESNVFTARVSEYYEPARSALAKYPRG